MSLRELMTAGRYTALDGVRAVAVLMVISWHVSDGAFASIHGSNGVTIFFLLSGFLITTLGLREERNSHFRYVAFLIRRAFRILPLLYLGVAVYALAIFVLHLDDRGDAYARAIPWIIGYFPEIPVLSAPPAEVGGQGPIPFAGVWSIGIEEKFYLIWPVIAFLALPRLPRCRAATAAALCASIWLFQLAGPPDVVRFISPYAPLFLGSALACFLQTSTGHATLVRLTHPIVSAICAVGACVLTTTNFGSLNAIAFEIVVAVLLTFIILRPTTVAARILSRPPLIFLGTISYALYLFHSFGLKAAERIIGGAPTALSAILEMILGLVIAIPACYLLHIAIERPLQQVGRRLTKPRPPQQERPMVTVQ